MRKMKYTQNVKKTTFATAREESKPSKSESKNIQDYSLNSI